MDWSKAKNILIIAFTITNLILIIVLSKGTMYNSKYTNVDQSFIENVKNELSKKNIIVETNIPNKVSNMAYLTLRYEMYDPFRMAKIMMNNEEYEVLYSGNKTYFKSSNKTLGIENKNKLVYENKDRTTVYEDITKSLSQKIVDEFLLDKGFQKDYELISYDIKNNTSTLLYKPVYKDMIIENNEIYMRFEVNKNGVKRFERTWVEIVRLKDKEMEVISAADVLLKLLSQPDSFEKKIKNVELCYKFDGDSVTTREGDAFPAWRIVFSDNTFKILK